MNGRFIFPVLLFLLIGTPAFADYQKGLDAYEKGDYATALKEWEPLAEQGNVDGQYNLGLIYDNGWAVSQDYKVAVKWYKLAAEQGFAKAQYNLGFMYSNGQGVTQNYKAAFKWYKLAAEQGYPSAQNNLGLMYQDGKGVAQDKVFAHMWFNISASQGNKRAMNNRDRVELEMASSQLDIAQEFAHHCVVKNYKDC